MYFFKVLWAIWKVILVGVGGFMVMAGPLALCDYYKWPNEHICLVGVLWAVLFFTCVIAAIVTSIEKPK